MVTLEEKFKNINDIIKMSIYFSIYLPKFGLLTQNI